MTPLRERIEYVALCGLIGLLKILPVWFITGFLRGCGILFYLFAHRRRRIALTNLKIAFPDRTAKERSKIARAAFDHFSCSMAESTLALAGKLSKSNLMARVNGYDFAKTLAFEKETKQGILFITGHFGNFELLAIYIGLRFKRPLHVVARKSTNKLIDDRIVTPLRKLFGNNVIYKKRALPRIVKALKKGEHIGLLIDIKSNARQGVPVTFFGQKTYAIKTSAYLQIKLNPLVIPVAMIRTAPNQYQFIIGDPIPWSDNRAPIENQIVELTQRHQTALENLIRQYPTQWLWMHDRWKRPELERTRRKKRKNKKQSISGNSILYF